MCKYCIKEFSPCSWVVKSLSFRSVPFSSFTSTALTMGNPRFNILTKNAYCNSFNWFILVTAKENGSYLVRFLNKKLNKGDPSSGPSGIL